LKASNSKTHRVGIALAPADQDTPTARIRFEQPAKIPSAGSFEPVEKISLERGAYTLSLGDMTHDPLDSDEARSALRMRLCGPSMWIRFPTSAPMFLLAFKRVDETVLPPWRRPI
jgi:hypothetical protein